MFSRQPSTAASTRNAGLSLSIGEKIALALTLLTLPFAAISWRLSDVNNPAIEALAEQRQGLHYLNALLGAQAAQSPSGAAEILHDAQVHYGRSTTAELAQQIERQFANAIAPSGASGLMGDLSARIASDYGLEAENGAEASALRAIALQIAPRARAQLGELGAAAKAIGSRRVSEAEAGDVMRSIGALETVMRPLDDLAAQTNSVPDLAPLAESIGDARRSLSFFSQNLLAQAHAGRLDTGASAPRLRQAFAAIVTLESQAIIGLDQRLKEKSGQLEAVRWRTFLLCGALIFAIFAAAWLFLRRTIVRPLRTLVDSTGSLVGGNYEVDIGQQQRGDEVGAIARFLETFRDIAQSRMRAEIARSTAESANLAKSQFLANMSHELRTPLNAIIGYSEILMEEATDNSADTKDLQRIHAAARHLLSLINDILDVSKIEAGRMELLVEDVDPGALLEDVVATARPLAEKSGARLIVDTSGAPANVRTDPMKLRQCLLNLLSNACKFTRDGEVRLSIQGFAQAGVPALRFIIADTGIGMTRQQMARLFQPFMQGDESITREFGGTGLGLMLTRHMAQVLGGDVSVSSEKGKGSTFTLWVTDRSAVSPAAGFAGIAEADPDAPLILIIDDERDDQALAAAALAPLGFRLAIALNAAAGLEQARRPDTRESPALILLDINLPDRPGWSVLAALKAEAATADIPVIVLSVDADRSTSTDLGAAEHLVKPVRPELLAAAVLRLARRRTGANQQTDQTGDHNAARQA